MRDKSVEFILSMFTTKEKIEFLSPFSALHPSQIKDEKKGIVWPSIIFILDFKVNRGFSFNFIFSKIVAFVIRYVHNGTTAHDLIWL